MRVRHARAAEKKRHDSQQEEEGTALRHYGYNITIGVGMQVARSLHRERQARLDDVAVDREDAKLTV